MRSITFRLDDDVYSELGYLAKVTHSSRNRLVNMLIRQEFDKYDNDPVLKKKLEQVEQLRSMLEDFSKGLDNDGVK